jgi:hypothetical protein
MIWDGVHWCIRFLFWVALALVVISMISNRRSAKVRASGTVEFAPRWFGVWGLMYVAVRMCFINWGYLRHGLKEPLTFATGAMLGFVSIGLVFMLPGTVLVTDSGLEQVFWLWRSKRIQWEEIVEITTERKGSAITVIGADKTKIIYSSGLPDRPRFLLEIRRHCGENLPANFPSGDANNDIAL